MRNLFNGVKQIFRVLGLCMLVFAGLAGWSTVSAQSTPPEQSLDLPSNQPVQIDDQKSDSVFGDSIFTGQFANQSFIGFNPSYEISVGDTLQLQMWGGFEFAGQLTVDAQGNVFIPRVGPVQVQGVKNGDLNKVISSSITSVYKKNVGVYASLEGAEPVKVFVTGFVRQPGLFAGHSSDSVLFFLDQAGGIDPARGSFLDIKVIRGGETFRTVNLYDFILTGKMPVFQILDGDTIVVGRVQSQIGVLGNVHTPAIFEFESDFIEAGKLLDMAGLKPSATHVRISRNNLKNTRVDYLPLDQAYKVAVYPGDVLEVTSDKQPGTISVRVEGEHLSDQEFVLPYGARLGTLLNMIEYGPNAQPEAAQLFRESVKARQKETLSAQLRALENSVLTARSETEGEANLRAQEAELIMQWVDRARQVEHTGQVLLGTSSRKNDILLEAGDIIKIPRQSNLIMVHGDVLFPTAMAFKPGQTVEDYIKASGGFTQNSRSANVLILHRDGTFVKVRNGDLDSKRIKLVEGDEIFVLPRVATKNIQIASEIVSILYQLALSAGVVLNL
ncbi:polysialic acid transporter KpsD [Kordiimonas sediminis]|uniref:Polysialic acid transporter KpsD n=1 Tax=Kordiimonas sediminis TaxID=1735581 RepID=A0A919AQC0_9PROT|nr:polysaccharide biosynthesis/export family protein [Kordiimonas sediminis]GHF18412.1 polysialic acid transporter KpsD [Kordiimonas sediminis]